MGIINRKERTASVIMVPIGRIKSNPRQPRRRFDQEALLGLAQSVRQNGILQPLTVRALPGGDYELVAGERRMRAALLAGFNQVPCLEVHVDANQSAVLSLLENLQRQDLNFFEEADGFARLIESCGMTQEEIAIKLGKSQSAVANKIRLLRLSAVERKAILDAELTERHARALLRLDGKERAAALGFIIRQRLNVYETDKLIESLVFPARTGSRKTKNQMPVIKDVRLFINTFTNAVNLMRKAGIDAVATQREHENYIEYTVKIPKTPPQSQSA
jgi:ParB family chromosome partitioning protein